MFPAVVVSDASLVSQFLDEVCCFRDYDPVEAVFPVVRLIVSLEARESAADDVARVRGERGVVSPPPEFVGQLPGCCSGH